jgi:cytidylate kinase
MAGRDIGTVVLPDADAKVYLTASLEERARRRHAERGEGQGTPDYDRVLEELRRRDKIDTERLDSPLKPAEDAIVLSTDGETVQDLARLVLSYVEKG